MVILIAHNRSKNELIKHIRSTEENREFAAMPTDINEVGNHLANGYNFHIFCLVRQRRAQY